MSKATVENVSTDLFREMENSSNAFVAVDYEYNFVFVNKVAEKFYSKSRSELIGKNVRSVFPELWDFGPFKNGRLKASSKLSFEMDYQSPFSGGWMQLRGTPYDNFYTFTYHPVNHHEILRDQLRKELKRK